jgi:Holliday junction resolvase RusA-like endonuclease
VKQIEIQISPLRLSKAYQGRRFKTSEYKKWQGDFARLVGKQTPLTGQLALTVEFYIKNDKMSDIDNFFKATLDTMKDTNIIEDDRFIYEIHAYKYHSEKEFIRITITNI